MKRMVILSVGGLCVIAASIIAWSVLNKDDPASQPNPTTSSSTQDKESTQQAQPEKEPDATMRIRITIGNQQTTATLEDNAIARAIYGKLPLTVPMQDLYGRELVYRFDEDLPTESLRNDSYEVGDIIYWPPRHSFVILYKQNGEIFSRQQVGRIDANVEMFDGTGDTTVTFEAAE